MAILKQKISTASFGGFLKVKIFRPSDRQGRCFPATNSALS
jgi:hypothetical protein